MSFALRETETAPEQNFMAEVGSVVELIPKRATGLYSHPEHPREKLNKDWDKSHLVPSWSGQSWNPRDSTLKGDSHPTALTVNAWQWHIVFMASCKE